MIPCGITIKCLLSVTSERRKSVFLVWIGLLLVLANFQSMKEIIPRFVRLDNCINISVRCRNVWIGKLLLVFLYLFLTRFLRIIGFHYLTPEYDVRRTLGTHHCNFGSRPCKDKIRFQMA